MPRVPATTILKSTTLAASLGWLITSSFQPNDQNQRRRQIHHTEVSLATRLELLRSAASAEGQSLSCLDDLAGSPLFDAWGRLARCSIESGTISLISSGPDQEFNSADDIELRASLHRPASLSKNP